jgi:magnesium transporter
MFLLPTLVATGPATTTLNHVVSTPSPSSPGSGYSSEQWNSIIGIVTAIVGNVMISFALNTQRYAHIRLEREWQEKERRRKKRSASYRSGQATRADERLKKNLNRGRKWSTGMRERASLGENDRGSADEAFVASEADPLLPDRGDMFAAPRPGLNPIGEEGQADQEAYRQESYLKSPYWWAGIILMTTGEAGNFLAYGFAPASIVSPLGVVALISNCIIAPIMLKEPFRARDALGLLVAVGGAVTVVLSASDNNPKLGPDEIWDLITTWEFETYLGITVGVIALLVVASNHYGDKSILIDLGLVGLFGTSTAVGDQT